MPELPEVETVRRGLAPVVVGHTVTSADVSDPRLWRRTGNDPSRILTGSTARDLRRHGKWLIARLEGDALAAGTALVLHLRMSGQVHVTHPDDDRVADRPHVRATLVLDDGTVVELSDMRRFGELVVLDGRDVTALLDRLGPDALDITPAVLAVAFHDRRLAVKRALCDQRIVAGIGNIYSDEALWRAGIRWDRPAGDLSPTEIEGLVGAVRDVLDEALDAGGTSARDGLYVGVRGDPGWFAVRLAVYQRTGEPCPLCGTPIARSSLGGSAAHWCPTCQT